MLSAVFSGMYPASVDDKGRVHVPAGISREINDDETMMVAIQKDGARELLMVFTRPAYQEEMGRLLGESRNDREQRRRVKEMAGGFYASSIKSGKLLIPQEIRKSFELEKNVQVVGAVDHIEIWNLSAWNEKNRDKGIKLLREDLDELGIL